MESRPDRVEIFIAADERFVISNMLAFGSYFRSKLGIEMSA